MIVNALTSVVGVLLAGGRSSRFGADKALALYRGESLLYWAAARFSPCAAVIVCVRGDSPAADHARALGLGVVEDYPASPSGPLSGIRAGLEWARAHGFGTIAVAPCDAPATPRGVYERLAAEQGPAPAAFAVTAAGEHPLCAIWRTDLCAALAEAMAGAAHPSVRGFLRTHGARAVAFEEAWLFANANTPGELARLEAQA